MTSFSKPYSKRNRLHKNVGDFVDDLNSRDQSSFDHLREWREIEGDLTFESREGQQDDYDGCDFLIHHANGSLRAQDKLRQVNRNSHNPSAGKDVGVEALRLYGWGKSENFKFVIDYGRDICKIPGESIQVKTGAGDQLRVLNRNYKKDRHRSDLYVVHPSGSPVVCCDSNRVKSLVSHFSKQIPRKVWERGDVYHAIRESFRGKRSYHLEEFLDDIPDGIQLICLRDIDRKGFSLNGMESGTALIAKVIVYIPPRFLTHIKL